MTSVKSARKYSIDSQQNSSSPPGLDWITDYINVEIQGYGASKAIHPLKKEKWINKVEDKRREGKHNTRL